MGYIWPTVHNLQAPGLEECIIRIRRQETLTMPKKCYNGCINHMSGTVQNLDCQSLCLVDEEINATSYHLKLTNQILLLIQIMGIHYFLSGICEFLLFTHGQCRSGFQRVSQTSLAYKLFTKAGWRPSGATVARKVAGEEN